MSAARRSASAASAGAARAVNAEIERLRTGPNDSPQNLGANSMNRPTTESARLAGFSNRETARRSLLVFGVVWPSIPNHDD